ncbi:hypothetical protein MSMEI_5896 [Mycolicibacterium smegmatis MC2 155]|uniref:Uncharacterized protein n=1 Tax=Mycolicibacterium smegmatis (strain ATCC 700084 / mc(2)155) TaxID=246196 RepID=I7GG06_MYCS2|nr:hypothetical protein MSMEI_2829 [Mycolicibacterium smegmatis MC2 155]AFP42329.1 hypothetical protein MSMEI_5896 [Mycolicibacterium smegmatis MC2 155]
MPGPVVADEGVENVGAPSCQADGGGDRPLSFVSFALVVGLGIWVAADRGQRRHVHDSAQSATVALGGVQSSGALSGVSRHWCQAGPGRELVSRSDQCGITDGSEEFGAESKSHAGHTGDHLGEWMAAKSALDVGVGGLDAVIEGNHLPCQISDQPGGHLFAGQTHRLGFHRGHRSPRDRGGVAHTGIGQDFGQPRNTALPNRFGTLVARQQYHPATVLAQLGGSFQGRADRDELLAQPVYCAGAVGHEVGAMAGEHPQLADQVIIGMQNGQVLPAHPRLVGDHPCIFGVGFGLPTAVGRRGLPHRPAGQVPDRFASVGQHRQQQGGIHRGQVHRPQHSLGQLVDFSHELSDRLLIVNQPSATTPPSRCRRPHIPSDALYRHPLQPTPGPPPSHLFSLVCQHDPQGQPRQHFLKQAITSQISISGQRSPGRPGGQSFQAAPRGRQHTPQPHPTHPGHSPT